MNAKKCLKNKLFYSIFGCFFALISLFTPLMASTPVFADPVNDTPAAETTELPETTSPTATDGKKEQKTCSSQVAKVGWIVCSVTEAASTATDFLYGILEKLIVVKPITSGDDSPVFKVWQYCRDVTNIVFIIYLLVVVYSQITGVGISNYGVKKSLPKLIIAAILVNISYIICQLGIDISNIFGESLRSLFAGVKESTMGSVAMEPVSFVDMFAMISSGAVGAIGGIMLAVETGAIWMLIPAVLTAIVSIFASVVTMAFRQAVIILLAMISPLAMVANIFPNTEQYFKKWKDYLIKMLIFFPAFSLMFGAADLAGWAIIVSSNGDTLLVILGVMVQFVPLFFSWKLLKMSGTLPGLVGDRIRAIGAKPIAANRAWADSHRELTRQKYLASKNAYSPSLWLTQFMSNRRIAREVETSEHAETVKNRGLAYTANRHYRKDGTISRKGEAAYELQTRNMEYQRDIVRDKNNFNKGLSELKDLKGRKSYRDATQLRRLEALDSRIVEASDNLKYEMSRGANIDYENARGFQERSSNAINAHLDFLNRDNPNYEQHNTSEKDLERYNSILSIMDHNELKAHFAAADAAYAFNAQNQIVQGKFQKYFDLTAPTQDVVNRLTELAKNANSNKHIDEIVAGLRVLNMRGDTDLVKNAIDQVLDDKKVSLGTYTSQSLANFLMFDVKDNDPFLRRFGKYINLETARVYNEADPSKRRHNQSINIEEYITGEYDEWDENGNPLTDANGNRVKGKSKRSAEVLLEGTSFKNIERTALSNMQESIRQVCITEDKDGNKHLDVDKYINLQKKINGAIRANIVGDQFNFLSGSEQINALGRYVTGMKKKDGKYITDDADIEDITFSSDVEREEAKKKLKDFHVERTKQFFGDQVSNQVARTKSDILAPTKALLMEIAEEEEPGKTKEYYFDKAGDMLRRSLQGVDGKTGRGGVYDNLVKMWHKGYQGDTKANLVEFLKLTDEQEVARVMKKNNKYNFVRDDDDGMPQAVADNDGSIENWDLNSLIGELDRGFMVDQSNTPANIDRFVAEMDEMLAERGLDNIAQAFNEYYRNDPTASIQSIRNHLEDLLRDRYN